MPQAIGKTYGFGRLSPETRPSPWLGVVAVALFVAASALTAAGFLRASARATAEAARASAPVLLAEDDEAARLARSAIALSGAALRR